MNRREFLRNSGLLAAGIVFAPKANANLINFDNLPQDASGRRIAEGYVFEDLNGNGVRDGGEVGIAGVCVSNGREVVKTDRNGKWRLPVDENTILFVIKPSGWKTPVSQDNLPRYYYIHKPNGAPDFKHAGVKPTGELPKSVDFPLQKQKEDSRYKMVLFGDPQPRNQKEINYIAHDVVEQVALDAKKVDAKFGLSLGDIMFDNLSLYESLNGVIGTIGLPWYNVQGNHDMNYDSPDDEHSSETFQKYFGPNYYSFNYAKTHFIVLDNVFWPGKGKGNYHGELQAKQLEFVKNDLAFVPKDHLVVICMHIPIVDVKNAEDLYRLIEDRPYAVSFSAHTHVQEHIFLTEKEGWKGAKPHHHLNHVTVCGSWWEGAPDERGIPHATMSDGAPNGYSIIEFDGHKYKVTYRAASRPDFDQMNVWIADQLPAEDADKTEVIVNVYAGSSRSVVNMRVDQGDWTKMTQFTGKDPFYLKLKAEEESPKPPQGLKLPGASDTPHLWKATLPAGLKKGTHRLEVTTTDMFGQTYTDSQIFQIV